MKVVITGGTGFLGLGIARALAKRGRLAGADIDAVTLFDAQVPAEQPAGLDGAIALMVGDIANREHVAAVIDRDDVCVFHLASVVSAGAEKDFDSAMRVNLDGGINVLEALRHKTGEARPRLVFASSLAVYGGDGLGDAVDDTTRETPSTTYGMTKAIGELMVNDYARKGFVDGRSARLPTVIIRPGPPNAAASGFASAVFREPLAGVDYDLPVAPGTRMMVLGARNAVGGLIALMDADGGDIGADRAVGLPNRHCSVTEMIAALETVAARKGIRLGRITPRPDPATEAIVTSWPLRMDDTRARRLGLPADDGLETIIEDYLEDVLEVGGPAA